MAHEVETMAFAHRTPWHGLGVHVPATTTPEEMTRLAGVDWAVEKRPLYVYHNEERMELKGRKALTRVTDGKVFDIVGDRWNPVQNADLMATFKKFCDAGGATMETAGSLRGGQIVWGLANLGNGFVLPNGDAVKGYLLLASRHQAGFATIGRVTPVRVVCANTFAMSGGFKGAAQIRVPHMIEFAPDWAADQMGLARAGMTDFEKNAALLSRLNITKDDAIRILTGVYQTDLDPSDATADYDRRANRTVKAIMAAAQNGAGQAEVRGTAWGLFNGATYYANHRAQGTADSRFASTLVGSNNTDLNKLFGKLVEMAG